MKLCAVSVDLDEIPNYYRIHGLDDPSGPGKTAVYDVAVDRLMTMAATAGLQSVGCSVVDVGLVATPTVQLAVEHHRAAGGIMLTASHNPIEWNALKFVGPDGIFLDTQSGTRVRELAAGGDSQALQRAKYNAIGGVEADSEAISRHLAAVLALPGLDVKAIKRRRFHVALDTVRGAGGAVMPELLKRLGCRSGG